MTDKEKAATQIAANPTSESEPQKYTCSTDGRKESVLPSEPRGCEPKASNDDTDDWSPGPYELLENPELIEVLRDSDPDYLDDLIADNPELADEEGA